MIPCTACPNPASHFCKECDKIFLCLSCSRKHSLDPFTSAHKLVGICSKHGKKLIMYCRKCGTTICIACRIANHPSDSLEHDVTELQTVAAEKTAGAVAALDRLDRTLEQKKEELCNIIAARDHAVATMDSDLVELGTQSDSAIEHTHTKQCQLMEESSSIQQQIEALMKQKTVVDEEVFQTGKKESYLRLKNKMFSKYLHLSRDQCMKEFKEAVEQLAAENDAMTALADVGREETTLERVLDGQTIPSLLKLKEEVTKAIDEAGDKVDPNSRNVEEKLVGFVPNSAPMEIGFLKRGSTEVTRKEISDVMPVTLNKFADVSYPANRPCKSLYSIRHLPDGRLASLYRSGKVKSEWADTITVHDPASPAVPLTVIDQNIQPGVDMTVTTNGELMVLRQGESSVRVFQNGGVCRTINLNMISDARQIEADEAGNISVGDLAGRLHVFTPDGIIRQAVQPHTCSFGECLGMSYDRPTRILYVANGPNILMYHLDGTTHKLREMSSDAHDVATFWCTDVCTNDGEVFAAGVMDTTREIRIYQVVEAEKPVQVEHAASRSEEELCASGRDILMCHWYRTTNALKEISSDRPHGLAGFSDDEDIPHGLAGFSDDKGRPLGLSGLIDDEELYAPGPSIAASRSKGELFAKGSGVGKDNGTSGWIRLNFGDSANRTIPEGWQPIAWITVFGNTLALGYHNKVELFHLPP